MHDSVSGDRPGSVSLSALVPVLCGSCQAPRTLCRESSGGEGSCLLPAIEGGEWGRLLSPHVNLLNLRRAGFPYFIDRITKSLQGETMLVRDRSEISG